MIILSFLGQLEYFYKYFLTYCTVYEGGNVIKYGEKRKLRIY